MVFSSETEGSRYGDVFFNRPSLEVLGHDVQDLYHPGACCKKFLYEL